MNPPGAARQDRVRRAHEDAAPEDSRGGCAHCGRPVATPSDLYCCPGCAAARALIQGMGLETYYAMLRQSFGSQPPQPGTDHLEPELFDAPEFQKEFVQATPEGRAEARLQAPGVTCYACVWLCEHAVNQRFPGTGIRINLTTTDLTLVYHPETTRLSEIVRLLRDLGYGPIPARGPSCRNRRSDILRIGIAGACALNIMALAIADYVSTEQGLGALDPFFKTLFRWAMLALSLPAVLYAGSGFFVNSFRNLRYGRLTLDLPIVVSIAVALAYSVANVIRGEGPVYFDSIAGGVTLLLAGRFVQRLVSERAEASLLATCEPTARYARRVGGAGSPPTLVPVEEIRAGERIVVLPGDIVPCRMKVAEGRGEISLERLTGEPERRLVGPGDGIPGEAANGSALLTGIALEDGRTSFWRQARAAIDRLRSDKGRLTAMSDRIASAFFGGVSLAALATLVVLWRVSPEQAMARAVAAVLIACPCAFGFAAPLTFTATAARALRRGVAFRSQVAIERLAMARRIWFDKTGTLTEGTLSIQSAKCLNQTWNNRETLAAVAEVAAASTHQFASAVRDWALAGADGVRSAGPGLSGFEEVFGSGIRANVGGLEMHIGKPAWLLETGVLNIDQFNQDSRDGALQASTVIAIDRAPAWELRAQDSVLPDAKTTVDQIRALGLEVAMLTGDGKSRAESVASALGIPTVVSDTSPSGKAGRIAAGTDVKGWRFIRGLLSGDTGTLGYTIMVGNGVNDSLALARATVGIAVHNGSESARQASDIYLGSPGIHGTVEAVLLARGAIRTLCATYAFAALYNLTGLILAIAGHVTPGWAALAMPFSSLMIVRLATLDLTPALTDYGSIRATAGIR